MDKYEYKDTTVKIQKSYNKDKGWHCMIYNNNSTNINKSVVYNMIACYKHKIN